MRFSHIVNVNNRSNQRNVLFNTMFLSGESSNPDRSIRRQAPWNLPRMRPLDTYKCITHCKYWIIYTWILPVNEDWPNIWFAFPWIQCWNSGVQLPVLFFPFPANNGLSFLLDANDFVTVFTCHLNALIDSRSWQGFSLLVSGFTKDFPLLQFFKTVTTHIFIILKV